ncbi:ABC transporter permease subunit [Paenibacillus sp. LjRoot153]|uniref:ABC transporter permease n=1 Tax=Paenibacillus sp. LjRoot153 TaxID=3342270 RepID=UPI003ED172D8
MGFFTEIRKNVDLYILALPGLLFLLIFAYVPMSGHLLAFKKYQLANGIWGSPWVGFDNFKFFFQGHDWIQVTFNTLFLNGLFIIFSLLVSASIAIFLNEIRVKLFKKLAQSIIFLPYFISWLVVSLMVFAILNTGDGLLNKFLITMGLPEVAWFQKSGAWPAILTIIYVWKFAGYYSVIFLASITGISSDYYEAAQIDGASRFQQIIHITIPLLRPIIIMLALLGVGRIFYGDFGMIYGIVGDNGVLFSTTDVIDTYSFRALRQLGNFSMSAAVVFYQSIMGLICILVFNGLVRKIDKDSSLF